jgi:hypothetical protein
MGSNSDSTDRTAGDYILFALAFIGFIIALGGITVSSPPAAFAGAVILLLAIASFRWRPSP